MKIIQATYGGVDCTTQIQQKVSNNNLFLFVNNNIIGDTNAGTIKYLSLEWEYRGEIHNKEYRENTWINIQNTKVNKLGIFYSNNNKAETQATIKQVLQTLQKSSHGKADILTCMWEKQKDNPFTEYISWTNNYGHVNQVLQILQLLYNAKQIGKYKYVSFLEHDVLYPEGYFDYKPFKKGQVLTNMNYMGLCKDGWQPRKQNDEPFHQMTMHLSDAITHMEKTLQNALVVGAGLVEPQDMKRIQWKCKNPAVHVNHGHHYTSHYSIYSNDVQKYNNYWGDVDDFIHLFMFDKK